MLAKLDELEDHPRYYRRRQETVTMLHDGQGRPRRFLLFHSFLSLWIMVKSEFGGFVIVESFNMIYRYLFKN
jgi:hypothetical protein